MGRNIVKQGANKFLLDVRIKKNGHELRQRQTFFGSKSGAEEKHAELRHALRSRSGISRIKSPKLFMELLKLYGDRRLALGSLDETRYRTLMKDLGEVSLDRFTEAFQEYIRFMQKLPSEATGKIRRNGTINRFVCMVKASFNLGVGLELIEKNPITKARFPMLKEVPRDKVLSEIEVDRFLGVMERESPHIHALTRFAMQVPCRRSELVNMRREDLDLFNNAIRVRNGTTKNDEGCWKPIPPNMVSYFRSLPPESPWLFYRFEKGIYKPLGDFKKSWQKCLRLAGLTDFRLHDTRHISATNLLDNGSPEQAVLQVAGWKTNMLRTYYHRSGKKALTLIRFGSASGHSVDTLHNEKPSNPSAFG